MLVSFGGKNESREPEKVDVEEFIAKKGLSAKGKKCHSLEVKKVEFIEPLEKAEEIDVNDIIDKEDEIDLPEIDLDSVNVPEIDDSEELTLF